MTVFAYAAPFENSGFIQRAVVGRSLRIPLFSATVRAGFPSPADYVEYEILREIRLNLKLTL